jgi:hypothetical protein
VRRLKALPGAVSKHFAAPKLEDATSSIELADGERELFSCWRDEGDRDKGVVLATDRRLILVQGRGTDILKDRGLATGIPGKITNSIDYTQIAAVKSRHLDPLGSLVRTVYMLTLGEAGETPTPLPRVRIDTGESESVQISVRAPDARRLQLLLASRTALDVPSYSMGRLPWRRPARAPDGDLEVVRLWVVAAPPPCQSEPLPAAALPQPLASLVWAFRRDFAGAVLQEILQPLAEVSRAWCRASAADVYELGIVDPSVA